MKLKNKKGKKGKSSQNIFYCVFPNFSSCICPQLPISVDVWLAAK